MRPGDTSDGSRDVWGTPEPSLPSSLQVQAFEEMCLWIPYSTSTSILSCTSFHLWTETLKWGGSVPTQQSWEDRTGVGTLEARASLTDKITGSGSSLVL